MSNSAINSINSVVSIFQEWRLKNTKDHISPTKNQSSDFHHYLKSIEDINKALAVFEKDRILLPTDQTAEQSRLSCLQSIKAVSLIINERNAKTFEFPISPGATFLEAISKSNDENFHSDYIASLLNTNLMGQFSYDFLEKLVSSSNHEGMKIDPTRSIKVVREKRLDSIDESLEGNEKGARRIDLYIRHNNFILIIENKIWSSESDLQTTDYFSVTKRVHPNVIVCGVLLSPDGQKPLEKEFGCLRYRQLISCLYEASHGVLDGFPKQYLMLYFESLFRQFIESDFLYYEMVKKFWRTYNER